MIVTARDDEPDGSRARRWRQAPRRADARSRGVTTDSRTVHAGDLFVALKGERFDGTRVRRRAPRRGAAAALASRPAVDGALPMPQVVVDDTRAALGRLAAALARRFALPVVALTGSNGKTTVKEMHRRDPRRALRRARCRCSPPRATSTTTSACRSRCSRLRERHRYAVIEMGMNHEREIDYLTRIAQPTVALVNNAHRAHVGILGSVEAIARAKGEIYAGLKPGGHRGGERRRCVRRRTGRSLNVGRAHRAPSGFGRTARRARERRAVAQAAHRDAGRRVRRDAAGRRRAQRAQRARGVRRRARARDSAARRCSEGSARFAGVPGRLQRRAGPGGSLVIDDSYNANPESMKAAIARARRRARTASVFVMGDMGELGRRGAGDARRGGRLRARVGHRCAARAGPSSRNAVRQRSAPGARHFDDARARCSARRAREAKPAARRSW